MKSINDYFDKIYCIHMEGDQERMDTVKKACKDLNCQLEWFKATTPRDVVIPPHSKITNGEFCCSVSHLRLWEKIRKDNPKRPLIFEDDIVVKDNIDAFELLDRTKHILLDSRTDIAFLGINYRSAKMGSNNLKKITDDLCKVEFAYALHAYSPTVDFLRKIHGILNMKTLYEDPKVIDVYTSTLLHKFTCVTLNPSLIYQKAGYSYLQEKHTDFKNEL